MLRRRTHEEACAVCAEKDKMIVILLDQVSHLRAQTATPLWNKLDEPPRVPEMKEDAEKPAEDTTWTTATSPYMSEEEADIRWAVANDQLTQQDAEHALRELGVIE